MNHSSNLLYFLAYLPVFSYINLPIPEVSHSLFLKGAKHFATRIWFSQSRERPEHLYFCKIPWLELMMTESACWPDQRHGPWLLDTHGLAMQGARPWRWRQEMLTQYRADSVMWSGAQPGRGFQEVAWRRGCSTWCFAGRSEEERHACRRHPLGN